MYITRPRLELSLGQIAKCDTIQNDFIKSSLYDLSTGACVV